MSPLLSVIRMRLHHSQDGSNYPRHKLMCFVYISFFHERQNALAFNRDTRCHIALCLQMMLLHCHYKYYLNVVKLEFLIFFSEREVTRINRLEIRITWCQCYKAFFLRHWWRGLISYRVCLGNPFQSGLRIWGQGQSQPNWSTFQMLPFWESSWCDQQMLD